MSDGPEIDEPSRAMPGALGALLEHLNAGVWTALELSPLAYDDMFTDIVREAQVSLDPPLSYDDLTMTIQSPTAAREWVGALNESNFRSEVSIVTFVERVFEALVDGGGEGLGEAYFQLVTKFIGLHNLRYSLRRPFRLSVSVEGMFSAMASEFRDYCRRDPHLQSTLAEFDDSVHELRQGATPTRLKACIQRQFNLLEAVAGKHPSVSARVLSEQIKQLPTWPHRGVGSSLASLYGFASDYPGIRHGGNPDGSLRELGVTDMASIVIALSGYLPLLRDQLDPSLFALGTID